jgi:type-F conjugative transfer system pilin assembly protein TrbC
MDKLKYLVAILCCGMSSAFAQNYIDIDKIKRENPVPNIDIAKAQAEATQLINQVKIADKQVLPEDVSKRLNIGNIEVPPQKIPDYLKDDKGMRQQQLNNLDLEKLAKKYNDTLLYEKDKAKEQGAKDPVNDFEAGRAYLFISSSIPKATLERLLNDAGKLNISVFLKGNIGDDPLKFQGTQQFMNTMKIETPPELFIHPDAFQMFKIDKVPALVVAASDVKDRLDEQGCAAPEDYDMISGDLKLGSNIEQIFNKASSPDIKDIARYYMKNVDGLKQFENK